MAAFAESLGWHPRDQRANAELYGAVFLDHLHYCMRLGETKPPPEGSRRVQFCDPQTVTYDDLVVELVDSRRVNGRSHAPRAGLGSREAARVSGCPPAGPLPKETAEVATLSQPFWASLVR